MADALARNHERIWLDPLCCIDERCWHEHQPENCADCELAPIEYVRADVQRMEIERLRSVLGHLHGWVHDLPVKHPQQAEWRSQARELLGVVDEQSPAGEKQNG